MASTPLIPETRMIEYLRDRPGSTAREAALALTGEGDTRTPQRGAAYGAMIRLERKGLIYRVRGQGPGDRWFCLSRNHQSPGTHSELDQARIRALEGALGVVVRILQDQIRWISDPQARANVTQALRTAETALGDKP